MASTQANVENPLVAARAALARADWEQAGELFREAAQATGWVLVMEADLVLNADGDPRATERLARQGLEVARAVSSPTLPHPGGR